MYSAQSVGLDTGNHPERDMILCSPYLKVQSNAELKNFAVSSPDKEYFQVNKAPKDMQHPRIAHGDFKPEVSLPHTLI